MGNRRGRRTKQAQTSDNNIDPPGMGAMKQLPAAINKGGKPQSGNSQRRGRSAEPATIHARVGTGAITRFDTLLARIEAVVAELDRLRQARERQDADDLAVFANRMCKLDELLEDLRITKQNLTEAAQRYDEAAQQYEEAARTAQLNVIGQMAKIGELMIRKHARNRGRGKAEHTTFAEVIARALQRLGREPDQKLLQAVLFESGAPSEEAARKGARRIIRDMTTPKRTDK